jgi:hypothetical protein
MRQTIAGLIAGAAFAATMATAPAQACAVVDPCGGGYRYSGYGYHGYGYGYGVRERLPDPAGPQYYWVNQGPTFTGPGNYAPVPTYQERAVIGSRYYGRPYRYGYDGGPYGNATSHYYDGAPGVQGPAVYSYRFHRRHHYRGYRSYYRPYRATSRYYARPSLRYGHAARHGYAPRFYAPGHSMSHGPRVTRSNPHFMNSRNARPGHNKPHTYKF